MLIVLTGNPNTGKTSLLKMLESDGYNTFNVDQYVKSIYEVNKIGYILISTHFGKEFTTPEGVDTKKLGDFILKDEFHSQRLKALIWPLIKSKLFYLKKRNKYLVVEMAIYKNDPLYFYNIFDYSIEITRDEELLLENNKSKFKIFYRDNSCFSPDFVIENNIDISKAYNSLKKTLLILGINEKEPKVDKQDLDRNKQ